MLLFWCSCLACLCSPLGKLVKDLLNLVAGQIACLVLPRVWSLSLDVPGILCLTIALTSSGALLILLSCCVLFVALYGLITHFRDLNKKMLLLFILYLLMVSYVTIFSREEGHSRAILLRFDQLIDILPVIRIDLRIFLQDVLCLFRRKDRGTLPGKQHFQLFLHLQIFPEL